MAICAKSTYQGAGQPFCTWPTLWEMSLWISMTRRWREGGCGWGGQFPTSGCCWRSKGPKGEQGVGCGLGEEGDQRLQSRFLHFQYGGGCRNPGFSNFHSQQHSENSKNHPLSDLSCTWPQRFECHRQSCGYELKQRHCQLVIPVIRSLLMICPFYESYLILDCWMRFLIK